MRGGKGFILVYSITDFSSYQDLELIHQQLLKSKDEEEVPIILVGNKCDLEGERKVSKEDGNKMAKKFGNYCKFVEASAKQRINIEEIFTELVRLINKSDAGEMEEEKPVSSKKDDKKDDKKQKSKPKFSLFGKKKEETLK